MKRRRRPRLGQHFLRDASIRRRLVESLALEAQDLVVEIGAGDGSMTSLLAERARAVVAVELDARLAGRLREKFQGNRVVEILEADFLRTDLRVICRAHGSGRCVVCGNIPYYVTSPILRHAFDFRASLARMALLVQREVAARLVAAPGGRDYGFLSVLAQFHSKPRVVFEVPPGAFAPKPKVHSSLVAFEIAPRFPDWPPDAEQEFLEFVKRCFAKKRKSLLNNLLSLHPRGRIENELARVGLTPRARAEELSVEQLATLFERFV